MFGFLVSGVSIPIRRTRSRWPPIGDVDRVAVDDVDHRRIAAENRRSGQARDGDPLATGGGQHRDAEEHPVHVQCSIADDAAHSTIVCARTYGEVDAVVHPIARGAGGGVGASLLPRRRHVGVGHRRTDTTTSGRRTSSGCSTTRPAGESTCPPVHDPADGAAIDLRSFFGRAGEVEWLVAGRAVQLVEWARTHRFCGRCGTPTEQQAGERAMRCPACGLLAFPRIAPAMITLVTRGERGVAGPRRAVPSPMYSCLAGFVEPGESLEGAVVREVREEVGVEVGNVRYWGSQPWPFPHSLMVGFTAEWQSGEIDIDPAEIVDARWFRRDELPTIPPPISIARKLIDAWLAGEISS